MRPRQSILRIRWGALRPRPSMRSSRFTLVELLVAMAVLSILMLMTFQFLDSAQRAWSLTNANTRVYENARIAIDLIGRDLDNAVASDTWLEEIPVFYDATDRLPVFVAASSLVPDNARSKLCEISYWVTDSSPGPGFEPYTLYRAAIDDTDAANWDFFREITDGWVDTPAHADRPWQPVIGGVESLEIRCFQGGAEMATDNHLQLPDYVQIVVTVFDENVANLEPDTLRNQRIQNTRRTFSKILFLGQQ